MEKKVLNTTYLYNPTEFQMNTAFAKAYTIESRGSKDGIRPNYFYIESSLVDLINQFSKIDFYVKNSDIIMALNKIPRMTLHISNILNMNIKGLDVCVYEISSFHILTELDGDDIYTEFGVLEEKKKVVID